MKQHRVGSLLFLYVLCCCSWLQGQGQINPQLQVLNSHFVGVWVGTNYDYTKPKTPVRLEIKNDPKHRVLRLEYTYGTKGQKSYDHLVRFMAIDPAKSAVTLNWQHDSKELYQADGLDRLLSTGYGDFTISETPSRYGKDFFYRATFHLTSDHLSYFWAKSLDGITFVKTGEWTLTREFAPNAPTGP